jgi:hypothetical protein
MAGAGSRRERSDASASQLCIEFSFGEGGGFLQGFLDATVARIWGTVVENSE